MTIVFLAPANNYHTIKWCNYFVDSGYEVHVLSLTEGDIPGVNVHQLCTGVAVNDSDWKKLRYLTAIHELRKELRTIKPDIISVHYASSYGALAALCGIKKYALSVWGTDVFEFPRKSILHKQLIKYSFSRADTLLSTSEAMAEEMRLYVKNRPIHITPFGVNMELFSPQKRLAAQRDTFVIGNIKSLSHEYGIRDLLAAVAIVRKNRPDIPLRVRIAGKGPQENEYKALSKELKIDDIVTWLGFISQDAAAREWANFDVAVIPSIRESFGVSAVEAQACGIPVIISNVDGLKEATCPGVTSLVVESGDADAVAEAIIRLHDDRDLLKQMGREARCFASERFEYNDCFKRIEKLLLNVGN